jgi:glucokinase
LKRFGIILSHEVEAMQALAMGVDLGGTNLRIAAVDDNGNQLESLHTEALLGRGRDLVIEEIVETVSALKEKYAATHQTRGLGLGVPGIIDLEDGSIHSAGNLPGWSHHPLRRDMESRLRLPVILENDANCAALGEKWCGAGKKFDDLCMITLGTGVGGGFVVNGKPWHGVTGMAGEIGHMTVVPDGVPCGCGSHGCLEQYASATAIRRMAIEAIAQGRSPALAMLQAADPQFSARRVFESAQLGDAAAQQIFETAGRALGIALANLINVLNLPLYVIGGGVANAWELLRPAMLAELSDRSIVFRAGEPLQSQHRGTIIARTQLGEDAGVLGAARLPLLMRQHCSVGG